MARSDRIRASGTPVVGALVAVMALAAPGVARGQASSTDDAVPAGADAQTHFNHARALFLRHEWAGALEEFRSANALFGSPNTRLYIARCLRETGQLAAAFVEFARAGAEAGDRVAREPRYAATRDTALAEGAAVRARVATLTLHVPRAPDAVEVTVNGQPVPAAGWDVATPFDPGEVAVEAHAPGRAPYHERVTLSPGQSAEVAIALEATPVPTDAVATPGPALAVAAERATPHEPTEPVRVDTPRPAGLGPVRTAGLIVGGVGLAGVAMFAIFGPLASGDYGRLSMRCPAVPCTDASLPALVDEGERWQALANVGLGIGIAGLVAGAILLVTGAPAAPRAATTAMSGRGWTVWARATGTEFGVRGAF